MLYLTFSGGAKGGMGGGVGLVRKFFRKLVLEILANLMKKRQGGVCALSRWSHSNDIFWETRGASSGRKC